MILTIVLTSGEELVAEYITHDDRQMTIKRPMVIEHAEFEDTMASRLSRYFTFDDGGETVVYMRHVIATTKCAQKMVDYYTKAVDKCYSDTHREIPDVNEAREAGITPEELISLLTGRTTIQ